MKRREDLETNDISCIWLEIIQEKGRSFLIGNLKSPPDSRIDYNDRFEDFMDKVSFSNSSYFTFISCGSVSLTRT